MKFRSQTSYVGAGEENRTLVLSLGSFRSTIELHPQPIQYIHKKESKVKNLIIKSFLIKQQKVLSIDKFSKIRIIN